MNQPNQPLSVDDATVSVSLVGGQVVLVMSNGVGYCRVKLSSDESVKMARQLLVLAFNARKYEE